MMHCYVTFVFSPREKLETIGRGKGSRGVGSRAEVREGRGRLRINNKNKLWYLKRKRKIDHGV